MTPPLSGATRDARAHLASLAARYHRAGWLLGTSGNLSAKVGDRVVITASGKDKAVLGHDDFVEFALPSTAGFTADALVLGAGPGARLSAETSIHLALYASRPTAQVVLHVHTLASTLALPDAASTPGPELGHLTFRDVEMIKGWDLWHPDAVAHLPVFANHADVPTIAADVHAYYAAHPDADVPAFLIRAHGLTAWGVDFHAANRHVEITEFLCQLGRARR